MILHHKEQDNEFFSQIQACKLLYFIHIPKTAGTFLIKHFIGERGQLPKFANLDKKTVSWGHSGVRNSTVIQFAIIRNPYDWLVSMYSHPYGGWLKTAEGYRKHDSISNVEFENYVTDIFRQNIPDVSTSTHSLAKELLPGFSVSPYAQILDVHGKIKVDFVIKYEHLTRGLSLIYNIDENIILNLPKHNISPMRKNRHYKLFYSDQLVRRVQQQYSQSLKAFGYSFEEGTTDNAALIYAKDIQLITP